MNWQYNKLNGSSELKISKLTQPIEICRNGSDRFVSFINGSLFSDIHADTAELAREHLIDKLYDVIRRIKNSKKFPRQMENIE